MKYPFRRLLILVFFQVLIFSLPVYSEDQSVFQSGFPKIDSAGYSSVNSVFLNFCRNQADVLHTNLHKLFNKTAPNDFLLKQIAVTSAVQDGQYPAALPSHATYRHHLQQLVTEPASENGPGRPSLYERMSEQIQSPLLAPYKYKRGTNTLLSMILPIPVTEDMTIVPIVSYTYFLDDVKTRGLLEDKERPVLYGGLNLSISF